MYLGLLALVAIVVVMYIALGQISQRNQAISDEALLRLKAEHARIQREEPNHPDAKLSEAEFILKHRDFAEAGATANLGGGSRNTRQIQIFIIILIVVIVISYAFTMPGMHEGMWNW